MENLLKEAVSRFDLEDVRRLLNRITETNFTSEESNRLVYKSIEYGQTEICQLLLEHKTKLNIRINDKIKNEKDSYRHNWYLLIYSIFYGRFEICKLLLDHGASLVLGKDGDTPLHFAAYHYRNDICKLLLNRGANFTARNNRGKTPAQRGLENGNNIEELNQEIINQYITKIKIRLLFII